jgi:hypothetical protein
MRDTINDPPKTDLPSLSRSIRYARWFVVIAALSAVLGYFLWFSAVKQLPLSQLGSDWGQFGDFVGGVLNPLVAFFAFYWLTRSVLLQKEELMETREALQDSSRSQAQQSEYARTSVRVAALNALINSILMEVQIQRQQTQSLISESRSNPNGHATIPSGEVLYGAMLRDYILGLDLLNVSRMQKKLEYEDELKNLLQAHR